MVASTPNATSLSRDVAVQVGFFLEGARDDFPAYDLLMYGVGLDVLVVEVRGGRSRAGAPHGLGEPP